MNDKTQEFIDDAKEHGVVSSCCDAAVYFSDICAQCGEHCESIEVTE